MSNSIPPVGTERQGAALASVRAPQPTGPSPAPDARDAEKAGRAQAAAAAVARVSRKDLEQAIEEVNKRMRLDGRNLAFALDEKADRVVIKVTNTTSGEVVRQIPDEAVLRIAHSIEELKGILYDKTT